MSERYDIMVYGPKDQERFFAAYCKQVGQMTKEGAEEHIKTLLPGFRIIGREQGTCQSVFQFWTPMEGYAVEIPHNEDPPTGRAAAVIAARLRK